MLWHSIIALFASIVTAIISVRIYKSKTDKDRLNKAIWRSALFFMCSNLIHSVGSTINGPIQLIFWDSLSRAERSNMAGVTAQTYIIQSFLLLLALYKRISGLFNAVPRRCSRE